MQAVAATHAWLDGHTGWEAPDADSLAGWMAGGACPCPDGCRVLPAGVCPHGLASWWLVLRSLDRPGATPAMSPERVVPLAERLAPERPDYVAVLEAHHRALTSGRPGYTDPATGLFVLTARSLWERGTCCGRGCRHCPYTGRPGRAGV